MAYVPFLQTAVLSTLTGVSGPSYIYYSHIYGKQQPIKIRDWFFHFTEIQMRKKPAATANLVWSDHGLSGQSRETL